MLLDEPWGWSGIVRMVICWKTDSLETTLGDYIIYDLLYFHL